MVQNRVVFLIDVDNTLLDNDRVITDLMRHLEREIGRECQQHYWTIFEELRAELGYADYLGALQRYRVEHPRDSNLLAVSSFLINYPFANRLFPSSLDVVDHLKAWGPDSSGNQISLAHEYEKIRDGKFKLKLSFDQNPNPGLYKVKTTINVNGETHIVEDEFAWGLVSLNTEKSIYRPGETAEFIIVVLDSKGHPVCDANLSMIISDPSLKNHALSSGNGIVANQECGLYDAEFVTVVNLT